MKSWTRSKKAFLGVISLVVLAGLFFVFAVDTQPRTQLSRSLHFLETYRPVRSRYVGQGYFYRATSTQPRSEVMALMEEFELPIGFMEAHELSRKELKSLAYSATFNSKAKSVIYGITDPISNQSIVVSLSEISEGRTRIVFKQTKEPTWIDRLMERIRPGSRP